MFTENELAEIVKNPTSPLIKAMRDDFTAYVRHVFGVGTSEYLSQINEYENTKQNDLRKKHAIRNPWIIDELVRPADNVWQAKGGDEAYTFTTKTQAKTFADLLNDVRGGMSLKTFMHEIWFERFLADPNGVIFLEATEDGKNPHFTYKSINTIKAYKTHGIKIDWIVFEPDVTLDIDNKDTKEKYVQYSWAIDDKFYYRIRNNGKNVEIEKKFPNIMERAPGIVCSSIFNTNKGYKVSLLDKQIDLLNSYLTKNSVKEIYQFKHNYALFWMYETVCPTCNGTRMHGEGVCATCNGTGFLGKKDVSDAFILPRPKPDERVIGSPAGYVQPDVATCNENRVELDWLFDKMFHSLWGTTVEKSDNETATGRFIDTMPVYNKLNTIADIVQMVHKELATIFALFHFPKTFKEASVSYSRRYIIEGPDTLWTRYQDARTKGAPEMSLNYMLEQFYYAEFASNQSMAELYIKLMYVEPYVHHSIADVNSMNLSDEIKKMKQYFPEWQKTLDYSDDKDITQLNSELRNYVNTINDGKTNEV
jgi:hypothetical protein